jgi:hypothetical protein
MGSTEKYLKVRDCGSHEFFHTSLSKEVKISNPMDNNTGSAKFIPPFCKGRLGGIFHGLKNRLYNRVYLQQNLPVVKA